MSSDDELHDIDDGTGGLGGHFEDGAAGKRRKLARACDVCRRKKIRCDAHTKPNLVKCSHCATYKLDCTFVEGAKKRSPPKAYIDDLEKRVELLEALIRRVAPTVDIDKEVGPTFNKQTWASVRAAIAAPKAAGGSAGASDGSLQVLPQARPTSPTTSQIIFQRTHPAAVAAHKLNVDSQAAQEDLENSENESNFPVGDGTLTKHIETGMEKLHFSPMYKRFHGKSSGVPLVQAALSLREAVAGKDSSTGLRQLRQKFWKPSPWEWMSASLPPVQSLKFPSPDLLSKLVQCCFEDALYYMPILHRPSLEKDIKEDRHRRDIEFARLLLMVCSVGAKYCEDPRVCLTSPDGVMEPSSAGWAYFSQVHQNKKPMLASVQLIDLQIFALSAVYLQNTSAPHSAWLIVGVGLRLAEDIGAHREKVYNRDRPFENQLWKRAFWSLVVMDKQFSASLGRPTAINDEDVDTQLPLEVDDGGWDETAKHWVQPADKPSEIAYFIQHIKLTAILAHTMRTLYSINKSKVHLGFIGPEWEQHTVSELDSALNHWQDAIPAHLRWDAHMQGPFYRQAAALRILLHYVQITVHRPFIAVSPNTPGRQVSPLSLPSLAICTNAARSSAHILGICMDMSTPPFWSMMAFISGVVLMISIWEAKRSGLNVDVSTQVADVYTCLKYLKRWETRSHFSGRMYDILREVASVSQVPIPTSGHPSPPDGARGQPSGQSKKRDRDSFNPSIPDTAALRAGLGSNTSPESTTLGDFSPAPGPHTQLTGSSSSSPSPYVSPTSAIFTPQSNPTHLQATSSLGTAPLFVPPVDPQASMSWAPPAAPPSTSFVGTHAPTASAPSMAGSDATWQNYHIAGASVPGLNATFPRMPGLGPNFSSGAGGMSPTSFLQDLLGPFGGNEQIIGADAQMMPPEFWGQDPLNQWNWMNEMTSSFAGPVPPNM